MPNTGTPRRRIKRKTAQDSISSDIRKQMENMRANLSSVRNRSHDRKLKRLLNKLIKNADDYLKSDNQRGDLPSYKQACDEAFKEHEKEFTATPNSQHYTLFQNIRRLFQWLFELISTFFTSNIKLDAKKRAQPSTNGLFKEKSFTGKSPATSGTEKNTFLKLEHTHTTKPRKQKGIKITPAPVRYYNPDTKPWLLACSGGGGHIAAIKAFFRLFHPENLTPYSPTPYKKKSRSLVGSSIFIAGYANYSTFIQNATACLGLPVLPQHNQLSSAINQLENNHDRQYEDVLLDYYDIGYECAGIWNIYQRDDKTKEFLKLVELQSHNDRIYHTKVSQLMFETLKKARDAGKPYSEVISTQAIGLPALCDAVKKYNETYGTTLAIHQYMTDLPSLGAVHFFNTLKKLSVEQQKHMILYAVDFNQATFNKVFSQGCAFQHVYSIDPKNNPMVREGFSKAENDYSKRHHEYVTLTPQQAPPQIILPYEKVATIMLGSQSSTDTAKYMETLLEQGMDKIFVFGGSNQTIKDKRHELIRTRANTAYQKARDAGLSEERARVIEQETTQKINKMIVLLGNQDDNFIASVKTRSKIIVTRAGGLSIMEEMAINHPEGQMIFIHHPDSNTEELTSGIPWEDCNANLFIQYAARRLKNIIVEKTCPSHVHQQLQRRLDHKHQEETRTLAMRAG